MITIRHTHEAGTIVEGSTRGDGVYEIARANGFTYRRTVGIFIMGSRDRVARRWQINAAAEALRVAGHEVEVAIDDTPRDRGTVLADQAERLDGRRERLDARAERWEGKAEASRAASDRLTENIPFGQPILVGHHSEKRHRRTLERAQNLMFRSVDEQRAADELGRRAAAVGTNLDHSARPSVTARRIKETESELRVIERNLTGYERRHLDHAGNPYMIENHEPASGEYRAQLEARRALLEERLTFDRAQLAAAVASGAYTLHNAETVHVGDVVRAWSGWRKVLKVNRVTVACESGYSWTDKIKYTDIREVRCEHQAA